MTAAVVGYRPATVLGDSGGGYSKSGDILERFFSGWESLICGGPQSKEALAKERLPEPDVLDYVFDSVESFTCRETSSLTSPPSEYYDLYSKKNYLLEMEIETEERQESFFDGGGKKRFRPRELEADDSEPRGELFGRNGTERVPGNPDNDKRNESFFQEDYFPQGRGG